MRAERSSRRTGAAAGLTLALALASMVALDPSGAPAARGAPLLAAAGDIACAPYDPKFRGGRGTRGYCRQMATSRLLRGADTVMPLGDTQDEHASTKNLRRGYDPSWGRYLSITRPVVGNHEYGPPRQPNIGAGGYWRYFGERRAGRKDRGWYSFDLGTWHVIALNSLCRSSHRPQAMQRKVGCSKSSVQARWLRRDLARTRTRCILAAWHHPRFSSGMPQARTWPEVAPLWRILDRAGADVVLSGHNHTYERFAKQSAGGRRSSKGIRQFVVGTGGVNIAKPRNGTPVSRNSQKRVRAFGVLRLRLRAGAYGWRFIRTGGGALDRGSASC